MCYTMCEKIHITHFFLSFCVIRSTNDVHICFCRHISVLLITHVLIFLSFFFFPYSLTYSLTSSTISFISFHYHATPLVLQKIKSFQSKKKMYRKRKKERNGHLNNERYMCYVMSADNLVKNTCLAILDEIFTSSFLKSHSLSTYERVSE